MKRFFLTWFVLLSVWPSFAVSGNHVKYIGGTVTGIHSGSIGKLDTTSDTFLILEAQGKKVLVPYKSIGSFQHTSETARHLGALPAFVVVLLRARQKRHFFRIAYSDRPLDQDAIPQVLILEVPKGMSSSLEAVLDVRASGKGRSCN